jgi:4-carboxymuconolactone decarboxylase
MEALMTAPPKTYLRFQNDFPGVARSYEAMGDAVHAAGPLDEKTRALVKLAISIGSLREGAVHSHTRKAIASGARAEELRHVAILALPTIGLPGMMAAMSWVNDVLDRKD